MDLSDLQLDPIEATEILGYMGVHPAEVHEPVKQAKLREVVGYFQNAPDKSFLITKLLAGKQVDHIDHLYNYITLRKEHATSKDKLTALEKELSIYER